jgi:hypothetical protein
MGKHRRWWEPLHAEAPPGLLECGFAPHAKTAAKSTNWTNRVIVAACTVGRDPHRPPGVERCIGRPRMADLRERVPRSRLSVFCAAKPGRPRVARSHATCAPPSGRPQHLGKSQIVGGRPAGMSGRPRLPRARSDHPRIAGCMRRAKQLAPDRLSPASFFANESEIGTN